MGRGQLQTLLVDRNYEFRAGDARTCSWVGLATVERCPVCGGDVLPTIDAVGELVRLTILENGQVEVGEHIPVLDELGGVAGLLRYA